MTEQTKAGLPAVVQALQQTRQQLLQEVHDVSEWELNAKPKREKWSIMQNLHHLHLIEQAVTGAVAYALQHNERKQVPAKPVALTVDRQYKKEAPAQLRPTETLLKEGQMTAMLAHSREELLQVLQQVTDVQELHERAEMHPVFGELSLYQWLEFLNLHEQRHLMQIQEAKQALHS